MRYKALFFTVFTLTFLGLLAFPAFADHGAIPTERTWGNGVEWEMLAPVFGIKAAHPSHKPLYIIGAIDESNPQSPGHNSDIGPHDHALAVPPGNHGTYSAIWHVFAVVPDESAVPGVDVNFRIVDSFLGPVPLVYEADLGEGLTPLMSAEEVELAEGLGLVVLVDIGIVFVCPIRPLKG